MGSAKTDEKVRRRCLVNRPVARARQVAQPWLQSRSTEGAGKVKAFPPELAAWALLAMGVAYESRHQSVVEDYGRYIRDDGLAVRKVARRESSLRASRMWSRRIWTA